MLRLVSVAERLRLERGSSERVVLNLLGEGGGSSAANSPRSSLVLLPCPLSHQAFPQPGCLTKRATWGQAPVCLVVSARVVTQPPESRMLDSSPSTHQSCVCVHQQAGRHQAGRLGLFCHPGGNPGANLKSISHRCHLFEVACVWELTKEAIDLPLGCLHGGEACAHVRD